MWIAVVRNTFYEIWVTQAENQGTAKGKRIQPCHLSFVVCICLSHFVTALEWRSTLIQLKFSHCWTLYLFSQTHSCPHSPFTSWKAMETHKHWVQLNSDPNKIKPFPSRSACVTSCQRFRSAIWSIPSVKTELSRGSSHPGQGAQGWWPIHVRAGAFVANSSVRLLGQSPFGTLRQNREDLGICCTRFKMSTVSNASRKEVSVNRFFPFLPFASLQFLFQ